MSGAERLPVYDGGVSDARGELAVTPDAVWDALPDLTKRKLEGLTKKQRDYALLVTHGVDRMDAYRYAYDVAPTTKDESVNANASKLHNTKTMKAAITAIEDGALSAEILGSDAPAMTKQWVLQRLAEEASANKKNTGAVRVRALELIGRAQGMFVDVQVVDDERPGTAEEAMAKVKKLLGRLEPASVEIVRGPTANSTGKGDRQVDDTTDEGY